MITNREQAREWANRKGWTGDNSFMEHPGYGGVSIHWRNGDGMDYELTTWSAEARVYIKSGWLYGASMPRELTKTAKKVQAAADKLK